MSGERKKPKNTVSIREGFSDRNGIKPENVTPQLYDFDTRTRIQILNLTKNIITSYGSSMLHEETQRFIRDLLSNVYIKEVRYDWSYAIDLILDMISDTIQNDDYDSVLSVVEYICKSINDNKNEDIVFDLYNNLFEKEYVGYRFVDKYIIPITNDIERDSIRTAIENSSDETKTHIRKALSFIANRDKPDFENSIKESISAVENVCNEIIGKACTLGDALKELDRKGIKIHPLLKEAFIKLYGYTSDGKGIRHAGNLGGSESTYAEAAFMLVTCSAFVNYLIMINTQVK